MSNALESILLIWDNLCPQETLYVSKNLMLTWLLLYAYRFTYRGLVTVLYKYFIRVFLLKFVTFDDLGAMLIFIVAS